MARTLDKLQWEFCDGSTKYVSLDNGYTFWPESDLDVHGHAISHDHLHVTLNEDSFDGPSDALSEFHITCYHNGQASMSIHVYFTVQDGIVAMPSEKNRFRRVDANGCGPAREDAIQNATGKEWDAIESLAIAFVQRAFAQTAGKARRAQQAG